MELLVIFVAFLVFFVGLEYIDKWFKLDKKDSKERLSYYKFSLVLVVFVKLVSAVATYVVSLI